MSKERRLAEGTVFEGFRRHIDSDFGLLPDHEHYQRRFELILGHNRAKIGCAVHSLGEVYAGLTAMTGKKRVTGDEALLYLQSIRARLTVVALTEDEYFQVVQDAAAGGIASGAIYDAIIGQCGIKCPPP